MVAFNGGTAAAIGRTQLPPLEGVAVVDLPSSRAAHTIGFDAKLDHLLSLRIVLCSVDSRPPLHHSLDLLQPPLIYARLPLYRYILSSLSGFRRAAPAHQPPPV